MASRLQRHENTSFVVFFFRNGEQDDAGLVHVKQGQKLGAVELQLAQ